MASIAKKNSDTDIPAILIVEDNMVNRLVITKLLDGVDCNISYAQDGSIAIDRFCSTNFDLILMDINMPIMDGIAATIEIRKLERSKKMPHTPIVAVTAHSDEEHRRNCNIAGMDGFIAKPIRMENLIPIVSMWIDSAA